MTRLLVVVAIILAVGAASALWHRSHRRDRLAVPAAATMPEWVTEGATRTWVVFTTEYCASCGPVTAELVRGFPADRLIVLDAAEQQALASEFEIRRAPTVLLIGADRSPLVRLVGSDDVHRYVETSADPAAVG